MRTIRLSLLVLLLLFAAHSAAMGESALYVAPDGSDDSAGTIDAPLLTLEAALARRPETVWLRGGTYFIEKTIKLTRKHRGPVAVRAHPGEVPVLTGAVPVTGWEATERGGQLLYSAPCEPGTPRVVYGADGRLQNARWPKQGELRVASQAQRTTSLFTKQRSFFADPADLPETLTGAIVRMAHYWRDELSGVNAYNAKTGRLTMNRQTSLTIFEGDAYWLENVLTAPLAAGEWAFDAAEKRLYYAPLDGEAVTGLTLYAGHTGTLIEADGVSDIAFEGVHFARTGFQIPKRDSEPDFPQAAYDAETALIFRNGQNIAFEGCTFRDMGAGCIRLEANVQDAAIVGCTFEEIGAQAVYVRGKNAREGATQRLTIRDNRISGYGRSFKNAPAVLLIHAREADIAGNVIHDGTYTAISAGWVWGTGFSITDHLTIRDNHLYDIGHALLDDMGAIYTLGVQKNTVISGNLIHDVNARVYGGWGIYLDEGASGITVENNIVYRCSAQGFHQHNGVRNTVRNNIFAYCLAGQVGASDKTAGGIFSLERNILVGAEPYFYRKYGVERIEEVDNAFEAAQSPAPDLPDALFALMRHDAAAAIAFEPFALKFALPEPEPAPDDDPVYVF